MAGRLEGKVALISGAAQGQGEAEARRFVAEGASVVIGDINDELGSAVAASLGDAARFAHLDVTDADQWAGAVSVAEEAFGPGTVLVNHAGRLVVGPRFGRMRIDRPAATGIDRGVIAEGVCRGLRSGVAVVAAARFRSRHVMAMRVLRTGIRRHLALAF